MARSLRATASTLIDRDIDSIFHYVTDFEAMDEWVVGVSDTHLVSGDGNTVGDIYEYQYTYGDTTVPMRVEVTAIEEPTAVGIRSISGPFPFSSTLTLTGLGDRTRITNTIEAGADSRSTAITFTLLRPLMRWVMARRLRAELEELQEILETQDVVSPTTSP